MVDNMGSEGAEEAHNGWDIGRHDVDGAQEQQQNRQEMLASRNHGWRAKEKRYKGVYSEEK